MTDPVLIVEVSKRPDEKRDYTINWAGETFRYWRAGAEVLLGQALRPSVPTGFEYLPNIAGQSNGKSEPKWPKLLATTVVDGAMTLTPQLPSLAGLRKRITASVWTPEDSSIVVVSSSFVDTAITQAALVTISGGVDEDIWDVLNHVTFTDGTELDAILRVTIQDAAD